MRIAYQGEPGAYSEAAALLFGAADGDAAVQDVRRRLRGRRAQAGDARRRAAGELHRRHHSPQLRPARSITSSRSPAKSSSTSCTACRRCRAPRSRTCKIVYSHPQALAQCERYLKDLGVTVEAVYDTAGGAKLVAEQRLAGAAALASRRAAEVFGLEVLQEAVQDFEFNITRFFVIGGAPPTDANKTTIVFALPSTPGSLFKALSVFALRDINLTKLESRPMRGRPWEYLFYVDIEARRDDLDCARALTQLGEFARWSRVLGTYRGWVRDKQVQT